MKYPSKYSNGKEVSAAQYITEIICERIAKNKKKDLHYRFWLSPDWEKEYSGQIGAANKLLKKYDFTDIIHGLNSTNGRKIYSLRAPHLPDIIEKTKSIQQQKPKSDTTIIQRNLYDKGKTTKKNTILDKIKDIENGSSR